MKEEKEWTLSESSRLLGEPQHRLIYLCEKGVIVPDYGDAKGRGSSRRFSARNLLEFVLALKLRKLTLPVDTVAAVIHVLRAFVTKLSSEINGFELVPKLQEKNAPDFRIIISDGQKLFFSLGNGVRKPKLFGGLDFPSLVSKKSPATFKAKIDGKVVEFELDAPSSGLDGPEGSQHARIEISVTRLAKDLPISE